MAAKSSRASSTTSSIVIRRGGADDAKALFTLFKAAALKGLLAREQDEVNQGYIDYMIETVADGGLMLVAVHPTQPTELYAHPSTSIRLYFGSTRL
jgi:thiaminase